MPEVVDIVRKVAPRAYPNYVNAFAAGEASLQQFAIDTPLRIAHFLAQVLHETGGGRVLFESLTYTTAARLMQIFGVGHHSAAVRDEEIAGLLNNPEALADRVYGRGNPKKAVELGNTRPGDGYRYRGGGALQTTGRKLQENRRPREGRLLQRPQSHRGSRTCAETRFARMGRWQPERRRG